MSHRFKSVVDTLATVLTIIAAGALLWRIYVSNPPITNIPGTQAAAPIAQPVNGLTIEASAIRHVEGTGPVVLVEFSDYQCPFCARHAQKTAPRIKKDLLDSGRIRHVFFNFPLPIHDKAEEAGEAAECAARQGAFWKMHQRLFEAPNALETTDLSRHAQNIGLNGDTFVKCLEGDEALAHVRGDLEEGRRLGVNSTPTFFLGSIESTGTINLIKRINGAAPFETFSKAVEDLVSEQRVRR